MSLSEEHENRIWIKYNFIPVIVSHYFELDVPTVPEGHKHRSVPRKPSENPADPRRTPQSPAEPSERPPQNPRIDPAESSERQISSESPAEGCAPRMVTLRNFRRSTSELHRSNSFELFT